MENIISFVNFRYEPIKIRGIIDNYIILLFLNIFNYYICKTVIEKTILIFILAIYASLTFATFIIIKNKKLKSHLYRGIYFIYLNSMFISISYHSLTYGSSGNSILLLILLAVFLSANMYILNMVKINIKNDSYSKYYAGVGENYGVITFMAGLGYLFAMFFLSNLTSDQGFIIVGICTGVLSVAFSFGNVYILKAYYMITKNLGFLDED